VCYSVLQCVTVRCSVVRCGAICELQVSTSVIGSVLTVAKCSRAIPSY